MRLAVLLSVALLAPATVFAHESKVTAEGMSEELFSVQVTDGQAYDVYQIRTTSSFCVL